MAKPQSYKTDTHERFAPGACSRLIFHVSVHTIPWVPEDVFFRRNTDSWRRSFTEGEIVFESPLTDQLQSWIPTLGELRGPTGKMQLFWIYIFHPCVERQKAFNWKGRNVLPSRAIDRLVLVPLTLTNMVGATHYEFTGIHIFKNR